MNLIKAILILFLTFVGSSFAGDTDVTFEDVLKHSQRRVELDKDDSQGTEQGVDLQSDIKRVRLDDCMASFGHERFCTCLNEELHWSLDFSSYVGVLISPDSEPQPNPSSDMELATSSAFSARKLCVTVFDNGNDT